MKYQYDCLDEYLKKKRHESNSWKNPTENFGKFPQFQKKNLSGGTQNKNLKEFKEKHRKTTEDATEGTAKGSPWKKMKYP